MVHHSAEPSGLPLTFGAITTPTCSEVFLLGVKRAFTLFRCNPSLRAAVITPPELAMVINLVSVVIECCPSHRPSGGTSGCVL